MNYSIVIIFLFLFTINYQSHAQDSAYIEDEVIYGKKDGMALTMIVASPRTGIIKKGIIQIVSSAWESSLDYWEKDITRSLIANNYKVFVVFHGSQPRYTIPDALADVQRAVRFIKYNAKEYRIDSSKIGVMGASAAGNLALLVGLMNGNGDPPTKDSLDVGLINGNGNPPAKDSIDFLSSKVQVVSCFFPPSDFLNYEVNKQNIVNSKVFKNYALMQPPFQFKKWDAKRRNYMPVTNTTFFNDILKDVSPIYYVSSDDPPILIIHGDKDEAVPIRQSYSLIKRLDELKIPSKFIIKSGGNHGWPRDQKDEQVIIDWFDSYLK